MESESVESILTDAFKKQDVVVERNGGAFIHEKKNGSMVDEKDEQFLT